MPALSNGERDFLEALQAGDLNEYSAVYKRKLKSRILKKRDLLTSDLALINSVIDKLQEV